MKTYWVFWTGYGVTPLALPTVTNFLGILIFALLFHALPTTPVDRVLIGSALIAPIWGYWVLRVKKIAGPVNLLVPQLRQRLLKISMAHWLIATLLPAFAGLVWGRADYFFATGLTVGCGLLAFTWLVNIRNVWLAAAGGIGLFCGLWLIADILRWTDHPGITTVILVLGWVVMSGLPWLILNRLVRDGVARHWQAERVRRKVPFRDAVHHWFLRRMIRACANTTLRPEVLARVRLEARLNFSLGPDLHWRSSLSVFLFFIIGISGFLLYYKMTDNAAEAATRVNGTFLIAWIWSLFYGFELGFRSVLAKHHAAPDTWLNKMKFKTSTQWIKNHGFSQVMSVVDDAKAKLMKDLLFLAPGLPQGLALRQAHARIILRDLLIVWVLRLALCALAFSNLPTPFRYHALAMIAAAELAMIGGWIGRSPYELGMPWLLQKKNPWLVLLTHLVRMVTRPRVSSDYVWALLIFAPSWYLESISLPLWTASCLLGGAAFLWLRWQKLAMEPDGLPAEWR